MEEGGKRQETSLYLVTSEPLVLCVYPMHGEELFVASKLECSMARGMHGGHAGEPRRAQRCSTTGALTAYSITQPVTPFTEGQVVLLLKGTGCHNYKWSFRICSGCREWSLRHNDTHTYQWYTHTRRQGVVTHGYIIGSSTP